MDSNPLIAFEMLRRFCVSDENDPRASLITATAVSFGLGIVASVATAYLLGATHLLL